MILKHLHRSRRFKRVLVWVEMLASFVKLAGIVLVAIELLKLQKEIYNAATYVGICLIGSGLLIMYALFGYTAIAFKEYSTAPLLVCGNCIYIMIGFSLIVVVHILPVTKMFAFLGHYSSVSSTDGGKTYNQEITKLEDDVWFRVTLFGSMLIGMGAVGATATITITYRLYSKKQHKEIREREIRRRVSEHFQANLKSGGDTWKLEQLSQRGRVYDYTAWGNRGKDLYKEKNKTTDLKFDDNSSTKTSMLSGNGLTTNFTLTSPFESASALIKSAKKFAGSLSPHVEIKQRGNLDHIQLSYISGNGRLVNDFADGEREPTTDTDTSMEQTNFTPDELLQSPVPNPRSSNLTATSL